MQYPYFNPTPDFYEKQRVKKTANCMGASYAFMSLLSVSVGVLLGLLLGFLRIPAEKFNELLEDYRVFDLMQIFISFIMFVPIYIVGAKLNGSKIYKIASYKKPRKDLFLPLVLLGIGVCRLSDYLADIFYSSVSIFGINPNMSDFPEPTTTTGMVLTVITIAIMPALVEEFAMRGIVLGTFRFLGDGSAILLSSLLFAFMHGNLLQIPFAFTVGMVLGFIAIKSGSVWTAVAVHFLNNLLSLSTDYCNAFFGSKAADFYGLILGLAMLFVGFVGLLLSLKKDKELFKLEKTELSVGSKVATKWALSAPFMIVAYIITAITVVITTFSL